MKFSSYHIVFHLGMMQQSNLRFSCGCMFTLWSSGLWHCL